MEKPSFLSSLVSGFLKGNMAILLILISLAAGVVALLFTSREEDPQIVVPLADVLVMYPGGSAEEVERLVSSRLEKMLYQIDGVEYVYSVSRPGMAVVTVRFFVGEDRNASLIKLYNQIFQNLDKTTPGITGWVIKPIEIDDVPIVNVALYSDRYNEHELYRVAEEIVSRLQHIPDSSKISIHGGQKRVVHVYLDIERLAAHSLSAMEVAGALKISNAQAESGSMQRAGRQIRVETGPFIRDAKEVENILVGVHEGRPVYLRDVAQIVDGPEEIESYSRIGFGPAAHDATHDEAMPAVTVALAKKRGSNAVKVAQQVEKALVSMRGKTIPDDVQFRIVRDYGATADEKVNGLITGLFEAIITVIVLIALVMNWRVGVIVAMSVPITYALTLLVNYMMGYTINRVTLFALILTLGMLVDDPIVSVENIYRHLSMRKESRLRSILTAMNEVMPPLVVATLAIVVAFLPMFFISGMMGPYMRPMAVNVPLAMLSSLLVSLTITPWLSRYVLRGSVVEEAPLPVEETLTYRMYRRMMGPFVGSRRRVWGLMGIVGLLFLISIGLAAGGWVPLKMLPFDNKNELQILVDMPETATLENTDIVVRQVEEYMRSQPEVTEVISSVGAASPMDFNGLVRHYYMRQAPNKADVRVNLAPRQKREMSSRAIALRIRKDIEQIGEKNAANLKIVEVPPGPPVLSTLVAEIYGEPYHTYDELIAAARIVRSVFESEDGIVDVDDSIEADTEEYRFQVDREKAGLNGISTEDVVQTMRLAVSGIVAGSVHLSTEQNEMPIVIRVPRENRSDIERLRTVHVKGRMGNIVQIGELGEFETTKGEYSISHKNQERVVYVTADTAGKTPAEAVFALQAKLKKMNFPEGIRIDWQGEGEWKITVDVFRDLGMAFAAALVGVYVLLVYEMKSFLLPAVVMLAIPLTLIGIMPGFWLLNVFFESPVGGFSNPVYFTATAMIGLIALAGIVVRNGVILVDFIRHSVMGGMPMEQAVLHAGAVRFRPIFLTAGTTMLGAWPITLDPIFSGLAWALIFGLFVSTAFTLVVIPGVYQFVYSGAQVESMEA